MGAGIPSGLVTFMFTDIEGSTRRWQADSDAMASAVAAHDAIVRTSVKTFGGHIFATGGDGFAIAFHSPQDAVESATEIQAGIARADWPTAEPIRIRIGAHLGTAAERNDDYFGPPVNLAARIEAAGHGGQILVSEDLAQHIDAPKTDMGEHRLKDIEHSVHIWQIGQELHPPLRTIEAGMNTLPILRTETIGREDTIADLRTALAASKLVTVTGPGGCGKTRIAVEAGAEELARHPGGVFFADLTTVDGDAPDVWAGLLSGLGLAPEGPVHDRVVGFLDGRSALLIIDNCEQVIDAAAEVVERLLDECAELTLLATSREALDVEGERVVRLPSLDVSSSARLFVARAFEAGVELAAEDDPAIESICAQLDGIPLAIELAAARASSMSTSEIASRLDDRFAMLSGGRRRNRRRQQTLKGVLDWSHDLLDEDEQRMLRRLSVFVGGFDLDDVAPVTGFPEPLALELVDSLVAKSLIDVVRLDTGSLDRRLLETVRIYGRDALVAAGEAVEILAQHVERFTQPRLAQSTAENMRNPQTREWELRRLANFEQAIEHHIEHGDLETAAALAARCATGLLNAGRFGLYRDLLSEQLDQAAPELRPSICAVAIPSLVAGYYELAGKLAERAAVLREHDPGNDDLIFAESVVGWIASFTDPARALAHADRLLEVSAQHSVNPIVEHAVLTLRCASLIVLGRLEEARDTAWQGADESTTSGVLNSIHGTWCDIMRGGTDVRQLTGTQRLSYGSFDYLVLIRDVLASVPTSSPSVAGRELAAQASRIVVGQIPMQEGDFVVAFAWLRLLVGQEARAIDLASRSGPRIVLAEAIELLGRGRDVEARLEILAGFSFALQNPEERARRREVNKQMLAEEVDYWTRPD